MTYPTPTLRDRLNDENEFASEVEAAYRDEGIAAARRALVGESRAECIDCEATIPELRRSLGGVIRCLDCQEIHELRKKQFAK
jgi:RNA polymerase-binding transcription factor DksA